MNAIRLNVGFLVLNSLQERREDLLVSGNNPNISTKDTSV